MEESKLIIKKILDNFKKNGTSRGYTKESKTNF